MNTTAALQKPPILFFKTFNAETPLYERALPCEQTESQTMLSFKHLRISADIPVLHDWISRPYSEKFWQLKGYTEEMLHSLYADILQNSACHALIGYYDGRPVCEIDIYLIKGSELDSFIPNATGSDCGIHLLMAPPHKTFKNLSILMLRAFMDLYFGSPFSGNLYAEPDELNALANRLAVKAGFHLLKKISLQHKTANLYKITKEQFLSQSPLITPL